MILICIKFITSQKKGAFASILIKNNIWGKKKEVVFFIVMK